MRLMEEPAFAPVAGTSPPWVSNTGHDLFRRATGALCSGFTEGGNGLILIKAWCNPDTGVFGRGAGVYGPYGGAGGFAAYTPARALTHAVASSMGHTIHARRDDWEN